MNARILLIEDDPELARILTAEAKRRGFVLEHADTLQKAARTCDNSKFDIIVMDLGLPDGDGMTLIKKLRGAGGNIPLVILSSRTDEIDRVLGLELGANDYVTKPFSVRELFARIVNHLRAANPEAAAAETAEIRFGDLVIDLRKKSVFLKGERVDLTAIEFRLLAFLAARPGQTVGRDELYDGVWGYANSQFDHTITAHMSRLRAKIESDPAHPRYLTTVHGMGYRFESPDES